jgi:glucose-6-phosphate 1-dehydrogenase
VSEPPAPHLFVVLGATGDLAARKLLPALYRLAQDHRLDFVVLGAGTRDLGDDTFRQRARDALAGAALVGREADAWCAGRLHYAPLPADDDFRPFAARVAEVEAVHGLPRPAP